MPPRPPLALQPLTLPLTPYGVDEASASASATAGASASASAGASAGAVASAVASARTNSNASRRIYPKLRFFSASAST